MSQAARIPRTAHTPLRPIRPRRRLALMSTAHANTDPTSTLLLDRWAVAMRAEGCRPNTIELRVGTVRVLIRHAGHCLLDVSTDEVRAWLADYENPNTRSTHYRSARSVFRWLRAEEVREDNPMDPIKAPRSPRGVPRPCTTVALRAMLEAADSKTRVMITLAAFQGLRAGEVAAIRGDHFDLDARTLRVVGKGGVEAVLPVHSRVLLLACLMPSGFWFPAPRRTEGHIGSAVVSLCVRGACADAGVALHGAHPLRHWFATWLVRGGADLRTTQTLMRHASLTTTAQYVQVDDEAVRSAMSGLPTLEV